MTRKLILSKTIIFIAIVGFIVIFKTLFGDENTLIGVSVITATLMFLERDLTLSPLKHFGFFAGINLILGILSFVASINIWLGLVCNFIALFIVGYLFSHEIKKPVYVPFGLLYLFMVSTPVSIDDLPRRFMSLIFGAAFIMLTQVLLNKNKLQKISNKNITLICDKLINKIEALKKNKSTNIYNKNIDRLSKELKSIIYDNRKEDFYITNKGMNVINILFSLNRMNLMLSKYNIRREKFKRNISKELSEENIKILNTIAQELKNIKETLKDNTNIDKKISDNEKNINIQDIELYELYNLMENIYENIKEYKINENEVEENALEIPEHFRKVSIYKRHFTNKSLVLSYAVKIGLLTAISGFIMDYFNLADGKWIMFTVFSLTQTYSETCLSRSAKRIEATLIGASAFFVIFTLIKDPTIRGLILIIAGYINSYLVDYKKLIICVTISSLGAAAMTSSPEAVVIARILYVFIGAVIAVLANKYILPYDAKRGYEDLLEMYKDTTKEILKEIETFTDSKKNNQVIKNLLLIPSLIEDRLLLINTIYEDKKDEDFIKTQKMLISDIYDLYINIKNHEIKDNDVKLVLKNMHKIINFNQDEYDKFRVDFIEEIKTIKYVSDKLVCVNLLHILDETKKMYKTESKDYQNINIKDIIEQN